MTKDWTLLMGAGDLAEHVYPLLKKQGIEVLGVRRNPSDNAPFPQASANARNVEDWLKLLQGKPSSIIITLTPDDFSDNGYEQGYVRPAEALSEALQRSAGDYRPFVLFISSTSVYSQQEGEWIDEDTTPEPTSFAGRRLLQAEETLREAACDLCVVRFSGIYGPGREGMIARLMSGKQKITPAWSNRIHVQDCVGVLAHLLNCYRAGQLIDDLYVGSDNLPVKQEEFVRGLAEKLGLDTTNFPSTNEVGPRGSKRCSNKRLLESGYEFIYPTWKDGYAAL